MVWASPFTVTVAKWKLVSLRQLPCLGSVTLSQWEITDCSRGQSPLLSLTLGFDCPAVTQRTLSERAWGSLCPSARAAFWHRRLPRALSFPCPSSGVSHFSRERGCLFGEQRLETEAWAPHVPPCCRCRPRRALRWQSQGRAFRVRHPTPQGFPSASSVASDGAGAAALPALVLEEPRPSGGVGFLRFLGAKSVVLRTYSGLKEAATETW